MWRVIDHLITGIYYVYIYTYISQVLLGGVVLELRRYVVYLVEESRQETCARMVVDGSP